VRNGSISNFGQGVGLGDSSLVEGLLVGLTGSGGITANGIVKGNIVGPVRSGIGIIATGVVTGNFVTGASVTGIQARAGSTVVGNATEDNGGIGIVVICPSAVADNTAVSEAFNGCSANITDNAAD
jgi:hypothetical protein